MNFLVILLAILVLASPFILLFTIVKESTAKIVLTFGGFKKVLLNKKGHIIDEFGDVAKGEDNSFKVGGLRFVGIRGINSIHRRSFQWTKAIPNGELKDKKEDNVDFVLAKVDYQYGIRIKNAEDRNKLPLNVEMVLTARIINPYKAIFRVRNWFEAVPSRIAPHVREYISKRDYMAVEEILPAKEIMKAIKRRDDKNFSIYEELKENYGVELVALETKGVDPQGEFRKSTLQKWQAAQDAEKRAGSTMATIMKMIAQQTNKRTEDIQREFYNNPEKALRKYKSVIEMARSFIEQQIAADAGSLRRYYFEGGKGGMDIIALLGDVLQGKEPKNLEAKPQEKEKNSETEPQKKENMTAQERIEKWRKEIRKKQ